MKEQHKEWTLDAKESLDIYVLKLDDEKEGPESIWANLDQLKNLRDFLNTLNLDGTSNSK